MLEQDSCVLCHPTGAPQCRREAPVPVLIPRAVLAAGTGHDPTQAACHKHWLQQPWSLASANTRDYSQVSHGRQYLATPMQRKDT